MSNERLEMLRARHRIVKADLAAMVAGADERRRASAELRDQTEALMDAVQQVCARATELHRTVGAPAHGRLEPR